MSLRRPQPRPTGPKLRTEDKITSPHGDLHGRSNLYLRYEVRQDFAG